MTQEILSIVLCFVSGAVVSTIVMIMLEMRSKINGLQKRIEEIDCTKDIDELYRSINDRYSDLQQHVVNSIGDVYRKFETDEKQAVQELAIISNKINNAEHELYRYIDSRLDKLEIKLTDVIKNGCEPVLNKH